MPKLNCTLENIGQALFIVNRHAKTAPDPTYLYKLKKETMKKLISEEKAHKIGLHYSNNPKLSRQHSVLLVQVGDYYFHMPPTKEDINSLEHLGHLNDSYRNPKPTLSLTKSKKILQEYLNWIDPKRKSTRSHYSNQTSSLSPFYHKRKRW
ncbi:YkyB family protein [Gracilibacillus kekensis]|uniref:YkyB-like protein n=1 Tax=Gracilibacillus kekensis TaxID=1027249 RepID=A0A1M7MER7_9BACI|nr:YkyB family protein [Gracilibacillus kekensis]SHM88860.1 YkyB-like protein [Gracilibacillus kekensis]